jgi:hypothetical protein
MCSERLNTALLFAESECVIQVGTHPAFVRLLNAKLHRILAARPLELGLGGFSKKHKARLSVLSCQILTEAATTKDIDRRSVAQILEYREAAAEESQRSCPHGHSALCRASCRHVGSDAPASSSRS